jgi:hypothetical protein
MAGQIRQIVAELEAAERRLDRFAERVPDERWSLRNDPKRWSVGECVEHLNLTSRAYLPLLEGGLAEARRVGGSAPGRYRRDPLGWLLWKSMPPPVRLKVPTPAPFIPGAAQPKDAALAEFRRLQRQQIRLVEAFDGLQLGKVRIASPFNARVKYNAFSCLTLLAPHQERHLWQAERVW